MHDCPNCRVPLHGYEEVCPSCGARQVVTKRRRYSSFNPDIPKVNWMPIVLVIAGVAVFLLLSLPTSWIGKLAREGAPKADPLEKMTYIEARNMVEQELTTGLTAVGSPPKLTWANLADGKPSEKTVDQPMNLTVDVKLSDPNSRKPVIDKVKDYLEKAKIPTLTMNDSATHAHWTYNMSAPLSQPEE